MFLISFSETAPEIDTVPEPAMPAESVLIVAFDDAPRAMVVDDTAALCMAVRMVFPMSLVATAAPIPAVPPP